MGWIKSLHCNSNSLDDVVVIDNRRRRHHHHEHSLPSCKSTVQNLKDIVQTSTKLAKSKNKQSSQKQSKTHLYNKIPVSRKPEPGSTRTRPGKIEPGFPTLIELPQGHPSRNVVEIIFHTSWGEKNFPGRVEMVFKVQNPTRTMTRFEEYREFVKLHASFGVVGEGSEDHARCVADGNEVMRFYCLGAMNIGGACEKMGGAWGFKGGKGAVVSIFSGSGVAHAKAGGGRGPRAMLVCRVISGRVCKKLGLDSVVDGRVGYDSVDGENGELVVFDPRALLPCFLIIYEL